MERVGAIAAGHPETARAAAEILCDGGNAFDAALGAMAVACVVEPVLASLGGGGFMMAKPAGKSPVLYDFFPQTPLVSRPSAEVDFFPILADFGPAQQEFHIGLGSIATPGFVKGMWKIHADLGSIPMPRIVGQAVDMARNGAAINDLQGYVLQVVKVIYTHDDACRAVFGSPGAAGEPALAGEILTFAELADTFEALAAEGDRLFYDGEIARKLTDDCRDRGGLLSMSDLAAYDVAMRQPLAVDFAGARVSTNPPPSTGGILIGFGLEMMKRGLLDGVSFGSADHLIRLAGVLDLTQKARIDSGLHERNAETVAAEFLDPEFVAAYRDQVLGRPTASRGTTQISVIDADGNAASATVTNGEGAAYIVPGTGIMMNNMLGEEDINPHGFHRWPENARLSSMMTPSLIELPSGAIEVTGSGGSNRIRTAMLQVLVNELAFEMKPADAVKSPRLHVEGDLISVEAGYDEAAISALAEAFPNMERWDDINFFFGGAHAVRFDPAKLQFDGVGDPRRGGVFLLA
jgi:gamma-glutamyltranspeptidase / glutathione hydrolase